MVPYCFILVYVFVAVILPALQEVCMKCLSYVLVAPLLSFALSLLLLLVFGVVLWGLFVCCWWDFWLGFCCCCLFDLGGGLFVCLFVFVI